MSMGYFALTEMLLFLGPCPTFFGRGFPLGERLAGRSA